MPKKSSSSSFLKSSRSSKTDDDEDEYENKSDDDDSELSPPSYSVVEDSNGSLVNMELEVKWPQRPKKGYYSKEEYFKRKTDKRHQQKLHQHQHEKTRKENTKSPLKSPDPRQFTDFEKFVGVQSSNRISQFLRPTEFVLYYRRPDAIPAFDEMPICMPLSIAYMTSKKKIYHFGIDALEDKSGTLWTVVLGNGIQQPYFRTMNGLINYYKTYIYLRKDGIEHFNVPEI